MKRAFLYILPALYLLATPQFLFAAEDCTQVGSILCLIKRLGIVVNPFIALLSGFAVLAFIRGVAVFVWTADNEEKRAEGKKFMIWGIVGLFVLFSFWGIIGFIQTFYFGESVSTPFAPPF